jgi:hypothetical protein
MNKIQLQTCLAEGFTQAKNIALEANPIALFERPNPDQWSAAENLQHLSQSAAALNSLLAKGKIFIQQNWGVPNWQPRSYDTILTIYKEGLANGIKAFGPFVPQLETGNDVGKLVANFDEINSKLIAFLADDWSDDELDSHVIPHPALKALSAREMFYFTALHTRHHAQLMLTRLAALEAK